MWPFKKRELVKMTKQEFKNLLSEYFGISDFIRERDYYFKNEVISDLTQAFKTQLESEFSTIYSSEIDTTLKKVAEEGFQGILDSFANGEFAAQVMKEAVSRILNPANSHSPKISVSSEGWSDISPSSIHPASSARLGKK